MRMRLFQSLTILAALLAPGLSRADDKDMPFIVLRTKSIDELFKYGKYVAGLAGMEDKVKDVEQLLKSFSNEQGLGGIDTKRPIGLYGSLPANPANPQESPVVILLPIADEKAFIAFLGNYEIKPQKGTDGVYTIENVPIPNAPIQINAYFRFENKYCYITAQDKGNIAKDKLLTPEKVFGNDDAAIALNLHLAALQDIHKQLALSGLDEEFRKLREMKEPNEPEAVTKIKEKALDFIGDHIKLVLNEGEDLALRVTVDPAKDELAVDLSLKAKAGSKLAKELEAVGGANSLFAGLGTSSDAVRGNLNFTFPEELKAIVSGLGDAASKEIVEKEKDPVKQALAKAALEKIVPTLKAGEIDAGVSVRGPDKDGHFTVVGGLKVKEGKGIDAFLHDLVKQIPEKDRGKVSLDADSAGEVKIHKATIDEMDENAKKIFGSPTIYLGISDDRALVGLGPDGLAAVKSAAALTPGTAPALNVVVSVARAAQLEKKQDAPGKVAKEVFGADPKGADTITVTGQVGATSKLRIVVKGKVISFGAKAQELSK